MAGFTVYENNLLTDHPELDRGLQFELDEREAALSLDIPADRPELVKLYERLGALTPNSPYFLVRLAELFKAMDAPALADVKFAETRNLLAEIDDDKDPVLEEQVTRARVEVTNMRMASQNFNLLQFYQKWKPSASHKFPVHLNLPVGHQAIRDRWTLHKASGSDLLKQYWAKLAIDTNQLESTFLLTEGSTRDLVRQGIAQGAIASQRESSLTNEDKIRSILNDTLGAFDLLQKVLDRKRPVDIGLIKEMHFKLMFTERFTEAGGYIAAGELRSVTKQTVVVGARGDKPIQLCPHEEVEQELGYICRALQDHASKMTNPFATASWLHLVLVRCHPFEDGNGRLTRLLSSYPLLKLGYPPISIARKDSPKYFTALNQAYDGDHTPLIQCIVEGMEQSLEYIDSIRT